jgi:hypothetical protein
LVHRMIYQVRNSAKQFLEIQLPEGADVWSVFVDNQPVESSMNKDRKLLIPLIRSRSANNKLQTFPVEVILALSEERFASLGSKGSTLPEVDLLISQMIWSVYLPNDYAYNYFSSTLEKEEIIKGVNLFSTGQRRFDQNAVGYLSTPAAGGDGQMLQSDELKKVYKGKEARSRFANVPMEEAQIADQMMAEMEFSARLEGVSEQDAPAVSGTMGTGVLPIMIQIPTSGQVYRFAKTIIKPEDTLTFSVIYSQTWISSLVKWVIFLLVLFILFLSRRKLRGPWDWLKRQIRKSTTYYRDHETTIKRYAQSRMTPFVLFGLLIIIWPFSGFLSIILLFLFWVSVVYQVLNFRRKKKVVSSGEPVMIIDETEQPKPKASRRKSKGSEK